METGELKKRPTRVAFFMFEFRRLHVSFAIKFAATGEHQPDTFPVVIGMIKIARGICGPFFGRESAKNVFSFDDSRGVVCKDTISLNSRVVVFYVPVPVGL